MNEVSPSETLEELESSLVGCLGFAWQDNKSEEGDKKHRTTGCWRVCWEILN